MADLEDDSTSSEWQPTGASFQGLNLGVGGNKAAVKAAQRRQKFVSLVRSGVSIADAREQVGVGVNTYKKWRERFPAFAQAVTGAASVIREDRKSVGGDGEPSEQEFARRYFGMDYAWFHLEFIAELERTPPGNILLALFPPEHGKTTMIENYLGRKYALNPDYRALAVSENRDISRKIGGRIKHRMEPLGPASAYVARYGPFVPQTGEGHRPAQPWGADYWSVYKKSSFDERDYSMNCLGVGSSIVSARTDHLHLDDVQSTKTLDRTGKIMSWFRQDALSRPGETGITTICGTRVGEEDFYGALMDEADFDGILKVIRYPAIITDPDSGAQTPLWGERYTMENMDRMRRKAGEIAWERNYMQNPRLPEKDRTFSNADVEPCLDSSISMRHRPTRDSVGYISIDPALGGRNCIMAIEVTPNGQLIVRAIRERTNLRSNEQIMSELRTVLEMVGPEMHVTDVVIEAMNFQRGLSRDERLEEMRRRYGFSVREHLTGANKYDANIGVPSMVTSFVKREIVLPWADDDMTRAQIGELVGQMYRWRPYERGNKLRQDMLMALWFGWILWRSRWKQRPDVQPAGFQRRNMPWRPTRSGLILPVGARP